MENKLIVMSAELGDIGTNCYIIANQETKKAAVVDPAGDVDIILKILDEKGLKLDMILLTHGHADHIGALDDLRREISMDLPVLASQIEQEVLMVPDYNLTPMFGKSYTTHANVLFKQPKQEYEVLGHRMIFYLTPGHTKGSCCYYFPTYGWLFTGDTLFAGSIGRTDFPTGSMREILKSVNDILMSFPDATIVLPGHGPSSTIGEERKTNPYVKR